MKQDEISVTRRIAMVRILIAAFLINAPALAQSPAPARTAGGECVMLQRLDQTLLYVSDSAECAVRTSPASTFKIPHALIALGTGVVANADQMLIWDGTKYPFATWERNHSLASGVKWSVVWLFRRIAASIGEAPMRERLMRIGYSNDVFTGDLTMFWLNGDLLVSPVEQLDFLRRFARYELPVERAHVDAVKSALEMPRGSVTNAAGTHPFTLTWKEPVVVRAKTGNTEVGAERVSWFVGHLETGDHQYVFVSRVRRNEDLRGTAGVDLARRVLSSLEPAR